MNRDKALQGRTAAALTMGMSLSTLRIMSTAAWSAEFLSPLPILLAAAAAAAEKHNMQFGRPAGMIDRSTESLAKRACRRLVHWILKSYAVNLLCICHPEFMHCVQNTHDLYICSPEQCKWMQANSASAQVVLYCLPLSFSSVQTSAAGTHHLAAASAAASVTRTNSSAKLRDGAV
jgi:hypothetical protein